MYHIIPAELRRYMAERAGVQLILEAAAVSAAA